MRRTPLLFAAAALGLPSTALAGGLFIPGLGPTAQARAGATVASVDDPSAIASNPAGLTETEGVTVIIGARFLDYSLDFTRRGSYDATSFDNPWEGEHYSSQHNEAAPPIGFGEFQALPMIVVSYSLEKQVKGLTVAGGLYVPTSYPTRDFSEGYVLDTESSTETEPPPPSRYDTISQEAAIVLPSLAAAYRINDKISVGGRFSWGLSNLEARTATWGARANYEESVQYDAFFHVKAKDNFAPAFGLGVKFHATEAIDIGLNWDSGLSAHNKGIGEADTGYGNRLPPNYDPLVIEPVADQDAKCAKGGSVGDIKACVDLALPMVTTLGARYKLQDKGDIELDVAWERWSAASDYTVTVDGQVLGALALNRTIIKHNLDDVISVRLGGGYELPVGAGLRVDGGIAYDTAAAPDGWERVDLDGAARTTFGAGLKYPVTKKIDVSAGGGYVYEGTRLNKNDCNPDASNLGCQGTGTDSPISERTGPDPAQPLNSGDPFESPFNAGRYTSHYVEFAVAAVMKF